MVAVFSLIILILVAQDNLIAITGLDILSYFDELLVIALLFIALFRMRNNKNRTRLAIFALLILFASIGILSCAINSSFIPKSIIMSCFLSIKFWLVVIAVSTFRTKRKTIDALYKGLYIVEKIVLAFALVNILLPDLYFSLFPASITMHRFGIMSVCSLFSHPGKYGWFMLFCSLAHFSSYCRTKKRNEIIKMIVATAACLLSMRTKVILGIVFCIMAYLLHTQKNNLKKWAKKLIILAPIILCILIPFRGIIEKTYILYFTDTEGYSVRQALSDKSMRIASDYFPLGVGFGKYGTWYASIEYSEYYYKYGLSNMYGITKNDTSYATDTFWPALFGETGIAGSAVFVAILAVLSKRLIKNCDNSHSYLFDILVLAPLVLVQTITESFGSASFSSPPEYIFAAVVIGISLTINNSSHREEEIIKKNEKSIIGDRV